MDKSQLSNLRNSVISLFRDDSSYILSGVKIAIKGAFYGICASPAYFIYKYNI